MQENKYWIVFILFLLVAGCLGGPLSDGSSSNYLFSFNDSHNEFDFTYNTTDRGGDGEFSSDYNNSVYSVDYNNDLNTDILAIGEKDITLFRNLGDRFVRSEALPSVSGSTQSALFFDHDNDGWQDLLLLRDNNTPAFFNNHNGEFQRKDVGLDNMFAHPVAASAADYNSDSCPDLFIAQSGRWADRAPAGWQTPVTWMDQDNGNPNVLYQGTCGESGFKQAENDTIWGNHWSLATSFADLNGDGHPDIHVANDFYNDTVYYNTGNGTFRKQVLGQETDRNGMSSEIADINGDGKNDVFVTNIYFPDNLTMLSEQKQQVFEDYLRNRLGKRGGGNNLLLSNNSTTGFTFVGERLNINRGGWGWAASVTDFNNDGWQDVFHSTQRVMTFYESDPIFPTPMLWAGNDNNSFRKINTNRIGFEKTNGRGISHLDFDRSGTADIALATYTGNYRLYRNNASVGNSLQVRVKSGALNHTSLGARVTVTVNGDTQSRTNNAKADYQSQDTRFLHFGLGDAESISELHIVWPDGTERVFEDVSAGQRIVVTPRGIAANASYQHDTD